MKTTNIQSVVNYDRYSADKYDRDIINAIPHHKELHEEMVNMLKIILIETKICSFDLGGHGHNQGNHKNALPRLELDIC